MGKARTLPAANSELDLRLQINRTREKTEAGRHGSTRPCLTPWIGSFNANLAMCPSSLSIPTPLRLVGRGTEANPFDETCEMPELQGVDIDVGWRDRGRNGGGREARDGERRLELTATIVKGCKAGSFPRNPGGYQGRRSTGTLVPATAHRRDRTYTRPVVHLPPRQRLVRNSPAERYEEGGGGGGARAEKRRQQEARTHLPQKNAATARQ